MSIHETVKAACEGKVRRTRDGAKHAARRLRKGGAAVAPYKCTHCGHWHVGGKGLKPVKKDMTPWRPREGKDRPTPERLRRGTWAFVETDDAGTRATRDYSSAPIDKMEQAGVLTKDQACAGRDYEELVRAASEGGGVRDSCTIWEPKGYESDDGPVEAKERLKAFERDLGKQRVARLRWVCVEHKPPRLHGEDVGMLREALNDAVRFFKRMR